MNGGFWILFQGICQNTDFGTMHNVEKLESTVGCVIFSKSGILNLGRGEIKDLYMYM